MIRPILVPRPFDAACGVALDKLRPGPSFGPLQSWTPAFAGEQS